MKNAVIIVYVVILTILIVVIVVISVLLSYKKCVPPPNNCQDPSLEVCQAANPVWPTEEQCAAYLNCSQKPTMEECQELVSPAPVNQSLPERFQLIVNKDGYQYALTRPLSIDSSSGSSALAELSPLGLTDRQTFTVGHDRNIVSAEIYEIFIKDDAVYFAVGMYTTMFYDGYNLYIASSVKQKTPMMLVPGSDNFQVIEVNYENVGKSVTPSIQVTSSTLESKVIAVT
jgi:hypothetical protein